MKMPGKIFLAWIDNYTSSLRVQNSGCYETNFQRYYKDTTLTNVSQHLAHLAMVGVFKSILDPNSTQPTHLRNYLVAEIQRIQPRLKVLLESVAILQEKFPIGGSFAYEFVSLQSSSALFIRIVDFLAKVEKIRNRIHSVAEFNYAYSFDESFRAQCIAQHGSQEFSTAVIHPFTINYQRGPIPCGKCRSSLEMYVEAKNKFLDSLPPLA